MLRIRDMLYSLPLSRAYATSRRSIAPSESRRTLKRSTIVAIGVGRRRVGSDNGSCRRLLAGLTPLRDDPRGRRPSTRRRRLGVLRPRQIRNEAIEFASEQAGEPLGLFLCGA